MKFGFNDKESIDISTAEGVPLVGAIDKVEEIDEDTLLIVDYKTSKTAPTPDQLRTDVQLSIYDLVAQQLWPGYKRIILSLDLLKSDVVYTYRTADERAEFEKYLTVIHNEMVKFTKKDAKADLNIFCPWCDYKDYCDKYEKGCNQSGGAFETRKVRVFEYNLPFEDHVRYYECRLVAVSDDLALGMLRNISKQVSAAAEKKRLLDQLQRAQKMEAIGMLAGGVAHDLNNVLSGLVSYPELILMDLPAESPLQKPIRTIQQSGERAADIVQDLLTLARRGVSVAEIVNLNQVIREYLKSPECTNLRMHHSPFQLVLDLADDLLDISGSPVHLTKTVMNLVSNAVEATINAGRIHIETANRYIDTPLKGYDDIEEGDYVVLKVTDNGIGISHEDINRIFEPFYTKKVMGRSGTGLGMAVVWGTVKDHHGYIGIESTQAQGTAVTIHLPATKAQRMQASAPETLEALKGAGERILVVDDIAEQRELATGMLTRLGYAAASVSSGEAAVEYVSEHRVDLLVLDMIMDPGIDGLETYRRILQIHPGQRAVITSGFSESERVHEARKLGAGAYVKKPYRFDTIARAVRDVLKTL